MLYRIRQLGTFRLRAYYGSLANLLPSHSNIFFHFLTSSSQVLSFSFYSPNRFSPNFTDSSLNHLSLVCPNYALLFRSTYIHPDRQKKGFSRLFCLMQASRRPFRLGTGGRKIAESSKKYFIYFGLLLIFHIACTLVYTMVSVAFFQHYLCRYFSLIGTIVNTARTMYPGWRIRIYHNVTRKNEEVHIHMIMEFKPVPSCRFGVNSVNISVPRTFLICVM